MTHAASTFASRITTGWIWVFPEVVLCQDLNSRPPDGRFRCDCLTVGNRHRMRETLTPACLDDNVALEPQVLMDIPQPSRGDWNVAPHAYYGHEARCSASRSSRRVWTG